MKNDRIVKTKEIKNLKNLLQERLDRRLLFSIKDIQDLANEKNIFLNEKELEYLYSNLWFTRSFFRKKRESMQSLMDSIRRKTLLQRRLRYLSEECYMTEDFTEIFKNNFPLWENEIKNHNQTEKWLKENSNKFDKHFVS